MEVWDARKAAAVEPMSLVRWRQRSGVVLLPPVVRPTLLTDQLRGNPSRGLDGVCGCVGCGSALDGPPGLGQLDPGSLALEINTMIAAARSFWDSLVRSLGIGAGRREADVITPLQDKITNTILAPAVQMGINKQNYTCTDMRKMLGVVQQARIEFKAFLTNTTWQDGRAAQQALVWLEGPLPASTSGAWFHQVENDFSGEVTLKCGSGGGGGIPPGGNVTGSDAMLPVLLGAALLILPRLR